MHFHEREGLCGRVDPYVKQLFINGEDHGSTNTATIVIPRDQESVHAFVTIWDDDVLLCWADDFLDGRPYVVDTYTGADECTSDGKVCYTATAIASPEICFDWNAQFLDAGPWPGTGSEDFLTGTAVQQVPASFARYQVQMVNSSGVLFDRGGVLDEEGCVPGPKLPIREHWQLGTDLRVTLRLISQLCLDPAGTDCPEYGDPPVYTGANVVVRQTGQQGPAEICAVCREPRQRNRAELRGPSDLLDGRSALAHPSGL
jgi:hypothetical protein